LVPRRFGLDRFHYIYYLQSTFYIKTKEITLNYVEIILEKDKVNRHNFGRGPWTFFYSNFISFHSVVLNKKILKDFQFRPICRLDTPLGKVTGHNFKRISQEYQCF
jgi:hypothetical protein